MGMEVTKKQFEAADLYSAMMEETKLRFVEIQALARGDYKIEGPFVRQYCFLQLRMICELIALGCLVAHGDIKATQSRTLRTEWRPSEIMTRLEELHPEFFPIPIKAEMTGPTTAHLADASEGALTKQELVTLYGKCGDVLHRGSMHRIITGKIPKETSFPDIATWLRRIRLLLDHHIVLMLGGERVFICALSGPGGVVSTQIGVADGPSKRVHESP